MKNTFKQSKVAICPRCQCYVSAANVAHITPEMEAEFTELTNDGFEVKLETIEETQKRKYSAYSDCLQKFCKELVVKPKPIRIWDNQNKQWLVPMAIFFAGEEAETIWKVVAKKPNEDPLKDGYYNLEGEDLKKISIIGEIKHNIDLLPKDK